MSHCLSRANTEWEGGKLGKGSGLAVVGLVGEEGERETSLRGGRVGWVCPRVGLASADGFRIARAGFRLPPTG